VRGTVHYRKVGTRLAQSISKVMLGARLVIDAGVVTEARVALESRIRPRDLVSGWSGILERFKEEREPALLYPRG
jgi:hypothetical protein